MFEETCGAYRLVATFGGQWMKGEMTAICGMWNGADREGMDGSNRGPWFSRGAKLYTMSDLFDTSNGMPPEPTAQDRAEDSEYGFNVDVWLEFHPLRRLRADLTVRVLQLDADGARVEYDLYPGPFPGDEEAEGPPGPPNGVMSVYAGWNVWNPDRVSVMGSWLLEEDPIPVFDSPSPSGSSDSSSPWWL